MLGPQRTAHNNGAVLARFPFFLRSPRHAPVVGSKRRSAARRHRASNPHTILTSILISILTASSQGAFLYRHVHSLHHKSYNPGPWSGLAMHPIERKFGSNLPFLVIDGPIQRRNVLDIRC